MNKSNKISTSTDQSIEICKKILQDYIQNQSNQGYANLCWHAVYMYNQNRITNVECKTFRSWILGMLRTVPEDMKSIQGMSKPNTIIEWLKFCYPKVYSKKIVCSHLLHSFEAELRRMRRYRMEWAKHLLQYLRSLE